MPFSFAISLKSAHKPRADGRLMPILAGPIFPEPQPDF
jgi:hypothetical protein